MSAKFICSFFSRCVRLTEFEVISNSFFDEELLSFQVWFVAWTLSYKNKLKKL